MPFNVFSRITNSLRFREANSASHFLDMSTSALATLSFIPAMQSASYLLVKAYLA